MDDRTYLYNLETDIGESLDLSDVESEKVNELYELLESWRAECGAEFPVPNPDFNAEKRYIWGTHPDRN